MKREKRVQLPIRVKESLKRDIERVAKKENVSLTEVSEAWLLAGQKEYGKNEN